MHACFRRPGPAEQSFKSGLKLDPGNAYLAERLAELRKEDGGQAPLR